MSHPVPARSHRRVKENQRITKEVVGTSGTGPSVGKRRFGLVLATKLVARLSLALRFRLKVEGLEHLPEESAFVLLPKHQRWEDIPLLALATPRPLYYMAKVELFLNPVAGWFISSLGGVPVNRVRPLASRASLRHMVACLLKGQGIVVFPEGTYHKNRMGPGHPGLIRIIHSRFEIPFVPVGIHYSEGPGRTRVKVRFGEPLLGNGFTGTQQLLERIMTDIAQLSDLAKETVGGLRRPPQRKP